MPMIFWFCAYWCGLLWHDYLFYISTKNCSVIKRFLCCSVSAFFLLSIFAQDSLNVPQASAPLVDTTLANVPIVHTKINHPVYKLKPGVDIPVFAVGAGWSAYAFTKIYNKEHSTEEDILALDKNNINWFDRWAVRPFFRIH